MNSAKLHTARVRAGRLVSLILLLQARGRVTAAELARELEVSERTILRDIDELSGAGVPVYGTRGPGGGFQLIDGYTSGLAPPTSGLVSTHRTARVRVRITPEGRRLAALLGRPQGLRIRRTSDLDELGRLEATFRMASFEDAVMAVLALSPHVEVVAPDAVRRAVAERATAAATLHGHALTERS